MNPFKGEKPPFVSSSRSQNWRGVRSQEGQSREAALSSAARSGAARRSISSPPCGAMRWLAAASAERSRSGAGTGKTETLVMDILVRIRWEPGKAKLRRRRRSPESREDQPVAGAATAPHAVNGAGRGGRGDRRLRARLGRLRLVGDDDPRTQQSRSHRDRLAQPPGNHAGPADSVGAANALEVDAGHDAVAEERHDPLALLLRRGLADGEVL